MSFRIATVLLYFFVVLAVPGLSQGGLQPLPTRAASVESSYDSLPKALQRIQIELKQIAEDIKTVEARMLRDSHNNRDQAVRSAPKIDELLKNDDPVTLIRDFFDASQDRLQFESCLKSGKLYRNLAAEIFSPNLPKNGEQTAKPALDDAFAQKAQLVFLSRMILELEVRYGEFQTQATAVPAAERAEFWQRLRKALRHDDQLLLGKLSAFLGSDGESLYQFAVRVLSQAQKTSPSTAATIIESMAILSPAGDLWMLADIPGINPAFLSALECEKRVMNSAPMEDFHAALLEALDCRNSENGSSVQAFGASQSRSAKSPETSSKAPLSVPNEVPHKGDIFRLPTEKELQDLQNRDSKVDPVPTAPSQPPAFGVSNTPVKRPKIPSWWIRCACPSDHPDAGTVFEGVRWHAPVLQCPNPELRRLEVK